MAAHPLDTIHDLTLLAEGRVTIDAFYTHVSPPPAIHRTVTIGWPDYTARFRRIGAGLPERGAHLAALRRARELGPQPAR